MEAWGIGVHRGESLRVKAGALDTQGNPFLVPEIHGFSKPQFHGELGGGGKGGAENEGGGERERAEEGEHTAL